MFNRKNMCFHGLIQDIADFDQKIFCKEFDVVVIRKKYPLESVKVHRKRGCDQCWM